MDKYAGSIDIEGMTCGSCVKTIESNVGVIPGVLSIQVELPDKEASVVLDPTVVSMNSILEKINNMGFVATQKNPAKEKTAKGRFSPDSSSQGAADHQADLASIFSGTGAGDLQGGKRQTARKPRAAVGGVEGGPSGNGGAVPSATAEGGQLASKPGTATKKKRKLPIKPAYECSPDIHPLTESKITVVVFDVETSGASPNEVIQLSAASARGNFNAYIMPMGEISRMASNIHNITVAGGRLYHGENPVPTKKKEEAWVDFIRFCEKMAPVLLVGHNVKFDAGHALNEISKLNLTENLMKVVAGFSDTLPLLRLLLPHLDSHKQEFVVSEILGADYTYESHNSEADVAALMEVLKKLNVSDAMLIKYGFTASSYFQHMKNKEEEKDMQDLYSPRFVCKSTLKKLAQAEYTYQGLERLAHCNTQEEFASALHPVVSPKQASNLYSKLRGF